MRCASGAIDRCAEVLSREGFAARAAWCGGEGARRLYTALLARGVAGSEGEGSEAAGEALGAAAAGQRVVLAASGFEGAAAAALAVREMARAGVGVLVVVPSHGFESGAPLPDAGDVDVRVLAVTDVEVERVSDANDLHAVERACVAAWERARRESRPVVVTFAFVE